MKKFGGGELRMKSISIQRDTVRAMAKKEEAAAELRELIERSQAQTGIGDVFAAYGRYEEYVRKVDAYFRALRPKTTMSTTDSTA